MVTHFPAHLHLPSHWERARLSLHIPRGSPGSTSLLQTDGGCKHTDRCGVGASSWGPPVTPGPLWHESGSPWCSPPGQGCHEVLGHTAPYPTPALICRLAAPEIKGVLSIPHWGRVRGAGCSRAYMGTSWRTVEGFPLTHTFIREAKPENILRGTRRLFSAPLCLRESPD